MNLGLIDKLKNFIKGGIPQGVLSGCISEPCRQYALYLHHSVLTGNNLMYVVMPGNYSVNLEVEMPAGKYKADWINPENGSVVRGCTFTYGGGIRILSSPNYKIWVFTSFRYIQNIVIDIM